MQGPDPDAGKGIVLRAFDGEASDGIPTLTKGYLYIKRILVCFNLNTVRARNWHSGSTLSFKFTPSPCSYCYVAR